METQNLTFYNLGIAPKMLSLRITSYNVCYTKLLRGIERRLITHSGHERWGLITKVPFKDENNQIVGIIGFTYEITERKQLIRELLEAKDRAEVV